MGASKSKLTKDQLTEYSDLTYFTEGEINGLYEKFLSTTDRSEINPEIRISQEQLRKMDEFKQNPFVERLCAVFSTAPSGGYLSFDDFVDMMNVLSEQAPFSLKAKYAFQIFDYNENGFVDQDDIHEIVARITQNDEGLGDLNQSLVDAIMREADLDQDNQLGAAEFEHVLSKSPDFMSSFKIRL